MTERLEGPDGLKKTVGTDGAAPRFAIVAGNPTATELAAVTAVLTGMLEELAEHNNRRADSRQSAWQRSQKPIRAAISCGVGAWRGFSG